MIKLAVPEKEITHLKPRISVIGVGGGGGNAVNNMIDQKLEGVDFIVANTDAQALAHSKAARKIQLGLETTKGLGAGARPEIGKQAAEEAAAEIKKELEGVNMVFITAGMGGGTGSGAAPIVAKIAKEMGILTVGVVTKPFQFEGRKRLETADSATENFTREVDSIIVIPNQNLFRVADKKTTLADAFVMADNVLYAGVRSITDLMMMPGLINLDFADIKAIMEDKGKAIMGTGEAEGDERAVKAAEQALANPLLDDSSIFGARGVLINITGGSDITLFEIDEAASRIKEEVDEDANIIFGSSFDETLSGKIRVSVVATGIGPKSAARAAKPQPRPAPAAEPKIEPKPAAVAEAPAPATAPAATITAEEIEQFSATKKVEVEEIIDEAALAPIAPLAPASAAPRKFEDFDLLDKSGAIREMPKASSLFAAIINKEAAGAGAANGPEAPRLDDILAARADAFAPKATLQSVEEEPELFPNHNPAASTSFSRKTEEPEELIVSSRDEYKPTFLDRITGSSIAKRNRKKKLEEQQAAMASAQKSAPRSFADDSAASSSADDRMNLEIPSFLRRMK